MPNQIHNPKIGYPEMEKSSLVLFDMAAFYLPLYNYDWRQFFPHYAVLGVVEGLIYQTEIVLEKSPSTLIWEEQHQQILGFLQSQNLITDVIYQYLHELGQYFEQVHDIQTGGEFDQAKLMKTAELRPSDIRLLHAILTQRLNQLYDESLFDLLWPLEVLLDIKANLTEYVDDVQTGHHNIYHQLVNMHEHKAIEYMQKEQEHYQTLLQDRLATASPENKARLQVMINQHEQEYPSVPIPAPILR